MREIPGYVIERPAYEGDEIVLVPCVQRWRKEYHSFRQGLPRGDPDRIGSDSRSDRSEKENPDRVYPA